jgi:phytoene dehydrogenase-like protein
MTMSIADLLDDWFESPQVKTMLAVSGVIGTWAGPFEPGTAYVMLHHHIGDLGDGRVGQWGFPEGGMGAVADSLARSAQSFGAEVRTSSPVARILTAAERAVGVALGDGTEISSDLVVTATHPQIAFLKHLDPRELPDEFVTDLKRWNTRSGVVKINLALSELPEFSAAPGHAPHIQGATIVHAHSIEHIEEAFIEARSGRPATLPFADMCIPSYFDSTLAPEGHHIMSMFTQWVPCEWATAPHHVALDAYVDRMIDAVGELAPNLKSSILHRQVIGPHEMEREYGLIGGNIFHGELSPEQLFHLRPSPGYADYRTPIKNLYQCGSATHGGGGVTGIPGRNVVAEIKKDRRLSRFKR